MAESLQAAERIDILLVEDSPADAMRLADALGNLPEFEHELDRADTLAAGVTQANERHYDVVLLDLGLPDSQGIDTFLEFRRVTPPVPVVVLTGLDDMTVGVRAIQTGAQDYLLKRDFDSPLLNRSVRYAIERHRLSTALAAGDERLQSAISGHAAGLWGWDPTTDLIFLAPRFMEILGYGDQDLPNEMNVFWDAVHPDDVVQLQQNLQAHLRRHGRFNSECRIRTSSGELRWIQVRGQAQWDDAGERYRMVGWILDITARRQVEADLRQSRQQMKKLATRQQEILEAERTRISREVHDELGQAIIGLKMDLHWLGTHLKQKLDLDRMNAMRQRIRDAEALADRAVEATQRIAMELRPSSLDHLGLASAIRDETRRHAARTGLKVRLDLTGNLQKLDAGVATAMFRIFQELLTNIVRHAKATKVDVRLRVDDSKLIMEVLDNGIGMPIHAIEGGSSLGLNGMRERAADFGGSVAFASEAGGGTRATVTIPLNGAPEANPLGV